ncbi:MAG: hypothetical protein IPJ27_17565 [Candidatus Accumulibacter sp.]|uniref:Uncharacterized protein n=1 Tax=Candidatus Accumulibacter proximus TaxID=2954385 RepID=A0A935Q3I4_9PROT|nr:hypothetical protein [Candidatus Accumulibacter proximus]
MLQHFPLSAATGAYPGSVFTAQIDSRVAKGRGRELHLRRQCCFPSRLGVFDFGQTQMLYSGMADAGRYPMATILLMQLFGPLATQTAIKGFGEATRLVPKRLDTPATPST